MSDWIEKLSEEEKEEIEIGINQADNNDFVDHNVVMKKFSKWHKDLTILNENFDLEP
jgi:predicted transcriptional regulator